MPTLYLRKIKRYQKQRRWQGAKTCNLATWKKDLLAIHGFDERIQGWGYEDSDLVIRLMNHGISRKSGKCATEVFHLWHPEENRDNAEKNKAQLERLLQHNITLAQKSMLNNSGAILQTED